jgi:hypothetical protein
MELFSMKLKSWIYDSMLLPKAVKNDLHYMRNSQCEIKRIACKSKCIIQVGNDFSEKSGLKKELNEVILKSNALTKYYQSTDQMNHP